MRAVIFDLDGTLLDSRPGIRAGLRHTLIRLGHQPPPDLDPDWAVGPPLEEVMARLLAPYSDGRVAEAVAHYRAWYAAEGLYDAHVYPGVPELIGGLVAAGRPLFVATAKLVTFARLALDHFGLAGHFRAVYGAEPGVLSAPKVELIGTILTAEGLDPARAAVVGDRAVDIAAARAHGALAVGAAYGYGGRAELEAAGADRIGDSPAELARLLA